MGPEAVAMKAKAQKTNTNPFESIWSRRKFEVMGQKRKGDTKRMGLARSLAIEKRNKTLLKEYEQSTKSSKFIDRRIGENDEATYSSSTLQLKLYCEESGFLRSLIHLFAESEFGSSVSLPLHLLKIFLVLVFSEFLII